MDYGIFLQPVRGGDGLSERLSDLAHFTLSDFIPTRQRLASRLKFPIERLIVQLANWVRAYFRQLARVIERRGHGPGHQLPVLPIIFVYGNIWRMDFAYRYDGKTMI